MTRRMRPSARFVRRTAFRTSAPKSRWPQFTVGERHVVFARREQSINPIVGFSQGLLRVTRDDSGVERVQTLDRRPLAQVESIGKATAVSAAPMRLADLRDRISTALRQAGRR